MALVLMDVDGTLLPNPSSETRFIAYLITHAKLGPVQIAAALGFYALYWRRFGSHVGRKNKAYLANLYRTDVGVLGERFVHQRLVPRLRPAVMERLRGHQRAGDRIALLTGAPEFIAAPLAQALGVPSWCATQCACRGKRFHWRPPVQHPLGPEKLAAAQRLCAQENVSLQDATAYADSIHDLELLEQVAHAVAVHPDRALRRIARERGWERLDSTSVARTVSVSE